MRVCVCVRVCTHACLSLRIALTEWMTQYPPPALSFHCPCIAEDTCTLPHWVLSKDTHIRMDAHTHTRAHTIDSHQGVIQYCTKLARFYAADQLQLLQNVKADPAYIFSRGTTFVSVPWKYYVSLLFSCILRYRLSPSQNGPSPSPSLSLSVSPFSLR